MAKMLFTSESVTEGHPDKVSDQVSDAVLDAIFSQDPYARVACETFCTTGVVTVMGEITTTAQVDIPAVVREVVCDIGYNSEKAGFVLLWLLLISSHPTLQWALTSLLSLRMARKMLIT